MDNTIINSSDDVNKWEELEALMYDKESSDLKIKRLATPTKDWDFFVTVGFIM